MLLLLPFHTHAPFKDERTMKSILKIRFLKTFCDVLITILVHS